MSSRAAEIGIPTSGLEVIPNGVALAPQCSVLDRARIRADWGLRATLMVVGYVALLALIARADTFYWAMMAAPLSLVGLAFAPRALRDLAAALRAVPVTTA